MSYEFVLNVGNVFGMVHRDQLAFLVNKYLSTGEYRFLEKDYCMVSMQKQEVFKKIEENIGKIYAVDLTEFFVISKDENVIISGFINMGDSNKTSILRTNFHGKSFEAVKECLETVRKTFNDMRNDENTIAVQWYYDNGKNIRYELIPEVFEDKIYQEAYPYISNIESMIEEYMNTPEPVLILMGQPGTGKTRLIRYIIKKMSLKYRLKFEEDINVDDYYGEFDQEDAWPKVAYATDSKILGKDQVFIDLLSGETFALVLEDMDVNLTSREDGNEMMNKMLSVSDGFLCNVKTKIIISTNIKNVADIDPALLRPGRCFATIETRQLDWNEAVKLAETMNIEIPFKERYTLAEVYSIRNRKKGFTNAVARKIGFGLSSTSRIPKPQRGFED